MALLSLRCTVSYAQCRVNHDHKCKWLAIVVMREKSAARGCMSVSLAGFFGWLHLHVGSNMSLVYGPVCDYDDVSRNLML